ncbi:thioredoxin domain-containing protein [Sulfurimonas sp. MAG313]|nr:thioredoxin domain-containing protein [Sulfurimonas sp. MAG313]MDF1879781.1 thioredoxin domain-containing protein [Sulfurimonas sp. MAG313]
MKFLFLFFIFISLVYAEFINSLSQETSPYLTQHQHNPVHWYAWNDTSLALAKKENKPIFLSIGYSTCHWCHVMAHESFENEKIAALFNEHFICIKVDKEEFPHLDKYYQNVYVLLKQRSGGWPLSAFLTENAKPFYVATYIPPSEMYNIEGLDTLLPRLANLYKQNKKEIYARAEEISMAMNKHDTRVLKPVDINLDISKKAFKGLKKQYDDLYYGFSTQPKFPEASKISLLFDLDILGVKGTKKMALETLRAMALRGLYDQVEGGFFRYSVDAAWEIPHFEKMLYTNAELIPLYVTAYELTQDQLYKDVVIETINMIEHRFEKDGVYFSASDADSGHEEGGYFIYSYEELLGSMHSLNIKEKNELSEAMDLSIMGNFEEKVHINFYKNSRPTLYEKIREDLKNIREARDYPFIDKKINVAWNSMMIEALFKASVIDEKYMKMAEVKIQSLINKMYLKGVLYHQALSGKIPTQKALLEDYAFLSSALIEGYSKNYDSQYLVLAKHLLDLSIAKFHDGKFWYLSEDGIKVHADMQDKYYKAPINKLLLSLLQMASLSGERKYLTLVEKMLKDKSAVLDTNPSYFPSALQVLLREKRGFITLKAKKTKLIQNKKQIQGIEYPFVINKSDNKVKGYLACDMKQCFSVHENLKKVIKDIENR